MTAEPRPGSGTPDADDGHTINVGPVTVADPGSGTPDPTPNGQTWVCRNGRPTARCVEDCPVAAGCGPVPPAPSSDTPSDERLCGHCAASNDPSPAHRYIVGRVARQCPGRPAPSPVPEASGRGNVTALLAKAAELLSSVPRDGERLRRWRQAATHIVDEIEATLVEPAPSSSPVPEAGGEDEIVQPTMHILRRADGEEMGEYTFWATDGPDGWDMAEDTDHDEDTVYEILACYPVARRKILWSTLCETCDGEGDGCPACAGGGECEPPDAEHMPIIARAASSSSPVGGRGLDVTALPEWEALRAAVEIIDGEPPWPPDVEVAARALLAAADREEPTDA